MSDPLSALLVTLLMVGLVAYLVLPHIRDDSLRQLAEHYLLGEFGPLVIGGLLFVGLYLLVKLTDWMVNVAGFIGGIVFLGLAGLLLFGIKQILR